MIRLIDLIMLNCFFDNYTRWKGAQDNQSHAKLANRERPIKVHLKWKARILIHLVHINQYLTPGTDRWFVSITQIVMSFNTVLGTTGNWWIHPCIHQVFQLLDSKPFCLLISPTKQCSPVTPWHRLHTFSRQSLDIG